MSNFKQTLAKHSSTLHSENQALKNCIQKVGQYRDFLNELHLLCCSLVKSYKAHGEKYLSEFESLETYRKTLNPRISLLNILSTLSSYSKLIGEFYTAQTESLIESFQSKNHEFSFEIENFTLSSKLKTINIIEDLNKTLAETNEIWSKIEESVRKHEELKSLIQGLEDNTVNADQKLEKVYKDNEISKYKEIVALEKRRNSLDTHVKERINGLKQEVLMICERSKDFEVRCTEGVEFFIGGLSGLLVSLLEFKKITSEGLNSTLSIITIQDSDNNNLNSPLSTQEMLKISEQKIEILTKLKNSLTAIAEHENSIPQYFHRLSKQLPTFKFNSDITNFTIKCLEDIQDSIIIQQHSAQEVQASIIKPIESLIKVQTTLNSSLQLSIKNISKNFVKTKEHFLNSPNRLSTKNTGNNENFNDRMLKFKENQSKQIKSLLNDHVNKENTFLLNIKHTLTLMHEKNVKAYEEVNELFANVNVSFKTQSLISSGFLDSLGGEKKTDDPVSVLKKTGRNEFKVNESNELGSDNEEFANRFDRNNTEPVIESFLCAYLDGILLQGKMYITASYLAFYSHFNSSTILGNVTVLRIPIFSILSLSKEKSAFIFDNSINLKTSEKDFFFTSFISRDQAFQILTRVMHLQHKRTLRTQNPVHVFIETRKPRINISKALKISPDPIIKMFPDSNFSVDVFEPEVEFLTSIDKVYQGLYSDTSKFYFEYLGIAGDTIEEITPWSSNPPDYFLGVEGNNWPLSATRVIKIRHKLKERLPLMPTHCLLIENQTIYFVNKNKFVIEVEFQVDAPYGEYFLTYVRWSFEGAEKTKLRVQFGIVFSSYTIFKGKIIKEGTKETVETLNMVWKPVASKFLIGAQQGLKEEQAEEEGVGAACVPVVQEVVKYRTQWELWGVTAVLLLILLKLWLKVKALEASQGKSQCAL